MGRGEVIDMIDWPGLMLGGVFPPEKDRVTGYFN